MGVRYTNDGLIVGGSATGELETFRRRTACRVEEDSQFAWQQASDVWGEDEASPFEVVDSGELTVTEYTAETWGDDPLVTVCHSIISAPMGSEDGEVSLLWDASQHPVDLINQVGPAMCIDLDAPYNECGITINGDISLGYTVYCQNVPRIDPEGDLFDYTRVPGYEVFTATILTSRPDLLSEGKHWLTLRKVGSQFAGYWDGVKLGATQTVPAWALGRDRWGIHAVGIKNSSLGNNGPICGPWIWRPYSGPL